MPFVGHHRGPPYKYIPSEFIRLGGFECSCPRPLQGAGARTLDPPRAYELARDVFIGVPPMVPHGWHDCVPRLRANVERHVVGLQFGPDRPKPARTCKSCPRTCRKVRKILRGCLWRRPLASLRPSFSFDVTFLWRSIVMLISRLRILQSLRHAASKVFKDGPRENAAC